jgi:hypothetical protein
VDLHPRYLRLVDAVRRVRISFAALRTVCGHGVAVALLAALVTACAGRGVPETVDPSAASAAVSRTAPDTSVRVVFDWTILDGEARFTGSGAARIEPPYRARLDLFGPRGEGYLSAALVASDVRLPPGTESGLLPPPALMWAVLGVVAPPDGAVLAGTRVESGRTELHYSVGDSRLRYDLEDGRLRSVHWEGDGRRMDVGLTGDTPAGLPREAVYRDWSGYTELRLNVEKVDEVDPFPPEIWTPGA